MTSPRALAGRLEAPIVLLSAAVLLAAPGALVWPGFGLALVAWLVWGRGATGWLARWSPLDVGWLALLAGSLLGFVVSTNQPAALSRLAAVAAALTIFSWLRSWAATPDRLRRASWTLLIICTLGALTVLALIQGQLPDSALSRRLGPLLSLFAVFPAISGDVLEVNSRFPVHQYGLAYLLLVITPFLAAVALLGSGRRSRVLSALGAVAATILLAATETRGAVLALAVAVALLGSLRSRWFWAILPLGALGLYALLTRGIISRSLETDWLATRLSIWSRSLNLLGDYPFSGFGLGMQTFAEVFAWNYGLPNRYQVVHSHNVLIQAYAEQGLLGLVGLLLVLGGGLLLAWRAARVAPAPARPAAAGVLGALVGSVLFGLTDQVPTTHGGLAIVAALCGLAAAGALSGQRTEPRAVPAVGPSTARLPARWPALLALGAVAVLLIGVLPRWISGLALNVGSAETLGVALNPSLPADEKAPILDRAEGSLTAALAWNGLNPPAYRTLARVRLLKHDVPGAVAALDQARALPGLTDYERTQIGRLYFEMGFWEQAFDLWFAAGQSDLLRQAADALAARRDYRAAAAAHATLVELHPDEGEHFSNLAKMILAGPTPGVDEAMRWFGRAVELKPEARRSLARQLVLEAETCRINERRGGGRFEVCVFWFSLASRIDPTYDKPEVELGSVNYYRGRYTEAADHFRTALQRDPRNSSTWHQLGETEEAAGRWPEAMAAYQQAVQVAPNRASLRASLGRVYLQSGRCDAARSELEQATRLPPEGDAAARAQAELARLADCR